ncbi:MAG: hypothetical protein GX877_01515 [Bacteroidales bacterium]|nr:hypothetical protein [Bacteroidales bacterium]
MKRNKIKRILDRHYNGIETPKHLEAKLSATIDRLAAKEHSDAQEQQAAQLTAQEQAKCRSHFTGSRMLTPTARRIAGIAALAILIITLAIFLPNKENHTEPADTCKTVSEAYLETEEVLEYISCLMNKGINKVSETQNSLSALQTIHKYIEIKEQ